LARSCSKEYLTVLYKDHPLIPYSLYTYTLIQEAQLLLR